LAAKKKKTAKRTGKKVSKGSVPVSSRGQQRKAKILAAATQLFLKIGYGETSIDAIVEKSGGSKATLTLVVFAEHRLRVAFSSKHRALTRLIIAERERFPDIARMYYEQGPLHSHTLLRDYFEILIDKGLIDIRSADEASEFFRGMLMHQRYIEQLYLNASQPSEEEIGVRARHVVDRFIEAYHQSDSS